MAGIGVAHRTSTQAQLRVKSLGGTNAAFAAGLAAEQAAAASSSPFVRGWLAVRRRCRRMRWFRLGAVVLIGSFVAAFLVGLNIDSPREREAPVGYSSVASAEEGDCIERSDLGDWGWGFNELRDKAADGINSVCRAFHRFGKFVSDTVLAPIGNFLWQAFHPNRFCGWRTRLDPDDSGSGLNALMMSANELLIGAGADDVGQTSTTWQQYGTAGTYWSTYFLDCFSSLHVSNAGANFVFTVSKVFSMAAILLFQQTFKSTIVDYFFVPQAGQSAPAVDEIIEKLQLDLYLQFFAVAVVIGGLVVLYTAVIKGGGLVEGLSKFGMMAAVAGIALAYAGNGPQYIQKANEFTDELGATVMSALVGEECTNSDGSTVGERADGGGVKPTTPPNGTSPTTTPPNQQAAGRGAGAAKPLAAPDDGKVNPYDCAAQTMYDVLIFRPWANGEIGTVEVMGDGAYTKRRKELAMKIMVQQSYSKSESNAIDAVPRDQRRADVLRRYNEKRDARFKMVKDDWGARFIAADGQPEADFAISGQDAWRPYSHVDTDYPEYWPLFSGGEPGQRFVTAIMALIASIAMAMILATISVAYLVLQLMTIILAMGAPVVFLLALIPIFGVRLLMRWFEMLAGMFIKRLGLIIFIGILLAGLQLVFKLPTPWWMQLLFVILIALAGISYRQQLSSWVTGGLEGMGKMAGGATGGLMGMKDAAGAAKKGAQTYAATKGMPASTRAQASANATYAGAKGGDGAQTPDAVRQAGQNQGPGQGSGKKGDKANQRSGTAQPHQPQRARNEPMGGRPQPGRYPPQYPPPDGSQVGVQRSSRNGPYIYEA